MKAMMLGYTLVICCGIAVMPLLVQTDQPATRPSEQPAAHLVPTATACSAARRASESGCTHPHEVTIAAVR